MSTSAELDAPPEYLGTARQHATANVPVAAPADCVDDVLAALRGRRYDAASVIAVVEHGALLGVATIERLLAARPAAAIADVMDTSPPVVAPTTDQEHAAWRAFQHGEPGLAVTDENDQFVGLISPQQLLGVLLAEHDEDLARIGGFLATSADARAASTASVRRRLAARLPWLAVGFVGALLSALLVGLFEADGGLHRCGRALRRIGLRHRDRDRAPGPDPPLRQGSGIWRRPALHRHPGPAVTGGVFPGCEPARLLTQPDWTGTNDLRSSCRWTLLVRRSQDES